jgi:uncharacterized Fe-S center protein
MREETVMIGEGVAVESQRAAHLFENMRGGLIAAFLCDAQARQAKTSGGECIRSGASIEPRLRTPPSHGRCECGRANAMREFFDKYSSPTLTEHPFTPGVHLTEIAVGKSLLNYDSLFVYTHFKGHTMGGFGGSLKNIGIGCASGQVGKRQIHGEGWPKGTLFLERMVESGKGTTGHFGSHITYINVLKNISIDCDCDAHGVKPTCNDIGILGSQDILAIDKASIDLVYALPEQQRHDIVERIESRSGLHQLEYMKTLHMGNDQYELIKL